MKHVILLVNLSLVILGGMVLTPSFVYAGDDLGLGQVAGAAKLDKIKNVPAVLGQALGAVLALVGIMFFLLMLYGGVTWMTAHGNEEQASKALKILASAIAGLIIVLASYTLVKFVFGSVGGGGNVGEDEGRSGVVKSAQPHPAAGQACDALKPCPAGSGLTCQASKCFGNCNTAFGNLGYSCQNTSQCDSATAIRWYCPGQPSNVLCCKPAASFSPPATGGGGCVDRADKCGGIVDKSGCTRDIGCVWDNRINSCTWAGGDCSFLEPSECKSHSHCEPGTLGAATCGKAGVPGVCTSASVCTVTSPATCPLGQVCCLRRKVFTPGS